MNYLSKLFFIKVFFILCLAFSFKKLYAQPYIDLATVHYQQSPDNSLFNKNKKNLKTEWVSANINAPLAIKKDYLIINPFFEYYRLRFENDIQQKIYSSGLAITYRKQWKNAKWQTAFALIPRVNSDSIKADDNDVQIGGAVLAIYKENETLSCKFGMYFNSEFFGPYFIPLIGIDWKATPKLNIFGVMPRKLNIEYKINNHFYGGAEVSLLTNSYRYENDFFLRTDDHHVKIYLDAYLTKNIVFTLQAGQSVARKFRTGIRENSSTTYYDLHVNDGMLFKAGIAWRMRLDDKIKQ